MNRRFHLLAQGSIIAVFAMLSLQSCGSRDDVEQRGHEMLLEARVLYSDGQYSAARDTIVSLRKRFPKAIEARREALLLLDSVELADAEGDTLKEEFYRRKLEFDIEKLKNGQEDRNRETEE